MGCTASTNTAIVTTKEVKGSKAALDTKRPLPPIGLSSAPMDKTAESAAFGSQPTRSKVESLPALPPIKMGRVTSNVAFEITDDSAIDNSNTLKRAPPKRLKRLQPIQVALTAEQLEEKQRIAEAKRNRIKQNIRLKSARAGKRRSVKLQRADEANESQLNADGLPVETFGDAAQLADGALNKRNSQQIENFPQGSFQPMQLAQVRKSEKANPVRLATEDERVIRSSGALRTAPFEAAASESAAAPKRASVSYRRRPSTPIEQHTNDQSKLNAVPHTARSDTAALADLSESALNGQSLFSTRRGLTEQLSLTIPAGPNAQQLEKVNSVLDDDADLGVALLDKTKSKATDQVVPQTQINRLGSAESGFISAAHSAQATGKKPLSESDILAFSKQTVSRTEMMPELADKTAHLQSQSQSESISFTLPPSYAGVNDSVLPDSTALGAVRPPAVSHKNHDDDYDF